MQQLRAIAEEKRRRKQEAEMMSSMTEEEKYLTRRLADEARFRSNLEEGVKVKEEKKEHYRLWLEKEKERNMKRFAAHPKELRRMRGEAVSDSEGEEEEEEAVQDVGGGEEEVRRRRKVDVKQQRNNEEEEAAVEEEERKRRAKDSLAYLNRPLDIGSLALNMAKDLDYEDNEFIVDDGLSDGRADGRSDGRAFESFDGLTDGQPDGGQKDMDGQFDERVSSVEKMEATQRDVPGMHEDEELKELEMASNLIRLQCGVDEQFDAPASASASASASTPAATSKLTAIDDDMEDFFNQMLNEEQKYLNKSDSDFAVRFDDIF